MKSKVQHNPLPPPHMTTIQRFSSFSALLLTLALSGFGSAGATDTGKTFATAEDAVSALVQAVSAESGQDLRTIFGPAAADIQNADRVQATNEFHAFTAALNQTNRLVRESDAKCVLEVGDSFWPFPIPITKKDGRWFFDTEAGKNEILSRRIGKNELNTLQVMRAYVAAQREYASRDRNGDEVLEFAQRIASTPGNKRLPFHGYFFKILTQQGKHAPGGKYGYIINGHMIGGFAMVAWPAEYGDSGIMTFIVNQQGRVFQKDLGPKTGKLAADMKVYDPDPSWAVSPD
jgi:hypothetical protein